MTQHEYYIIIGLTDMYMYVIILSMFKPRICFHHLLSVVCVIIQDFSNFNVLSSYQTQMWFRVHCHHFCRSIMIVFAVIDKSADSVGIGSINTIVDVSVTILYHLRLHHVHTQCMLLPLGLIFVPEEVHKATH